MLKIHHLGHSQSERIVWLCEELELQYELVKYTRDAKTRLSPPELVALHPLGAAPVIETDGIMLAESAAIAEYILMRFGNGRLRYDVEHPRYATYLYWFHFANGNLQPAMFRAMTVGRCGLSDDHPLERSVHERLHRALALMDTQLAEHAYLAGDTLTAADVMSVFSLTTMRLFFPVDLTAYAHILAYLQRVGERPAYRRAMARGDADLVGHFTP